METTKTKPAKAKTKASQPDKNVKKSRFAEYWEKYPNGCGEIIDYRAVLK
jgi:hypothetical protein